MEPCPVSMHTGNGTFRALADRLRSLGWMDTIPLEGKRPLVSRRHGTARKHVSGFDLDEWQSLYPNANVGIVLPTLDAGDMMAMAIDVDSAAGHERKEDGAMSDRIFYNSDALSETNGNSARFPPPGPTGIPIRHTVICSTACPTCRI